MNQRTHSRIRLYIQIASLALFCLLLVTCAINVSSYQTQSGENPDRVQSYNDGWRLSDGSEIELPGRIAYTDGAIEIYNFLPELENGMTISLQTHAQRLYVWIDGKEIYRFADSMPHGDTSGKYLNMMNLPDGASGKEIRIRLESEASVADGTLCMMGSIQYGVAEHLELEKIKENAHILFVFGFSVVSAVFLFAFAVLLKQRNGRSNVGGMLALSEFILLSGSWLLTDSILLQFFVHNRVLIYYLSFLLFMLLPVAFLQYLKSILAKPRLLLDIYSIVALINCAVVFFLDFTDRAILAKTLPVTHLLLVGMVLLSPVLLLIDILKEKNKTVILPFVGIGFFGLCALISLLLFGVENLTAGRYSIAFILGFLVFILCVVLQSIIEGRKIYIENAKLEVYRQLAVSDVMTGLSNRTAFDADMESLGAGIGEYSTVSIAVLDINGLKQCNDAYGHHVGDRMIKACGNCIMQTFTHIGKCYRIGGDEFAILFYNEARSDIDRTVEDFFAAVETYNTQHTHKLSVAVGVATATGREELMTAGIAASLFKRADQAMYRQKTEDKASAQHTHAEV